MTINRNVIAIILPLFLLIVFLLSPILVDLDYANADSFLGDEITIEYVGETQYCSAFSGAKYKIVSPSGEVFVAFEDDFEWVINDETFSGDGIPYISINSLASIYPDLYTAPVFNNETYRYESFVILKSNGDLYSKCIINDQENTELEYAIRVDKIDWVGPRILIETEEYWVDWTSNKYITHYSVEFSDTFLGLRYPTESSGISTIEVFYINRSLSDLVNENIINPSNIDPIDTIEEIKEEAGYRAVSEFNNVIENTPLSFDISDSGYYYYLAIDIVGNITLGFLGMYTQLAQEGFDLTMANGGVRNVYEYFQEAKLDIAEYTGIISQIRVDKLQQALDTSYFAFLMGENQDNLRYYYDLFSQEWAIFKEGKTQAFFEIKYSKPEEFPLSFLCINLNKDTIECINGDEVYLDINISKFDKDEINIDPSVKTLIVNDYYNVMYKIDYSLTLNGIEVVPKTPLFFDFIHNGTLLNISLISTVDDINPQLLTFENGINYLRITSMLKNREFYIFGEEKILENNKSSLLVLIFLVIMACISAGAFILLIIWVEKQRKDFTKKHIIKDI